MYCGYTCDSNLILFPLNSFVYRFEHEVILPVDVHPIVLVQQSFIISIEGPLIMFVQHETHVFSMLPCPF